MNFDPIFVDKSMDLDSQKRDLPEPTLELPLPDTSSPADNWSQEQMDLLADAPSTATPPLADIYREMSRYMQQAQPQTLTVQSAPVKPLPVPVTRSPAPPAPVPPKTRVMPPPKPVVAPVATDPTSVTVDSSTKTTTPVEGLPLPSTATIPITVSPTPVSTPVTYPISIDPVASNPVPRMELPSTETHRSGNTVQSPRLPSMGNVAIDRLPMAQPRVVIPESLRGADVMVHGRTVDPLPLPSTTSGRREIQLTHSTDDPSGVFHAGVDELNDQLAYSHLADEMLLAMKEQHQRERDFRASQLHVMHQMGADLAEDCRRLSSIESGLELGRETLSDVNI